MLYKIFVSKKGMKCNCLVISSPPVCRPRVHIHIRIAVYCLKLEVKLDTVIITSHREFVDCLMKLKGAF